MKYIGETLRRERQGRNLSVDDVARELKIAPRFLKAIEDDDFDKLPGGVFSKSFVRQYAGHLGLDPEPLVTEFVNATQPPEQLSQPVAEKPPIHTPEIRLRGFDAWKTVGDHSSGSSWVTAAAIVVAVMLICSAVVWWWERPRHPVMADEAAAIRPVAPAAVPAAAPPAQPVAPPVTEPAPAQPDTAQGTSQVATAPATSAAPVAAAPATQETNPNAAVRVAISAEEPVWVRARSDGKTVFSATLQPKEARTVTADANVELLLGNAGGATITLNGKPITVDGFPAGAAGPKGQIRTVQLTSGGFQIVPPKEEDDRDFR